MPDSGAEAPASGATAEAQLYIPNDGTIHALVVFVQQAQDTFRDCIDTHKLSTDPGHNLSNQYDTYCAGAPPTGRYQSRTEDPATEWPAFRMVNGVPTQVRPDWADRVIDAPGTNTSAYQSGSLSHFFWEMSRGTFKFEGRVYPDLITLQSPTPQGNLTLATIEVINRLRTTPHGLDFSEFDRYNNTTGLYTPDADGDGEPDGDGIFDMLIIMPRTGGGIASLGNSVSENLGGILVRGGFPRGSGVYSSGFDFHRQIAAAGHEVGHLLIGGDHPCDDDLSPTATGDLTSLMCGPRFRRMSAPDRIRLGWLTPRLVTAPTTTSILTLDPSPMAGDAVRITQGGLPTAGDVLVEARSFNDVWDGPPAVADGDVADQPFLVREGIVVHQIGPTVTTPSAAHDRYSSMDNTGVRARRDMHFDTIYNAWVAGVEPPHVGYAPGDAFTPLSRFRFNFKGGPLDTRVALTNITTAPSAVSLTLWGNFLTASANRTIRTNYTLANHAAGSNYPDDRNRGRIDDWTFGGTLQLGGTHARIRAGDPTITLLPESRLAVAKGGNVMLWGPNNYTFPVTAGKGARVEAYGTLRAEGVAFSASNADGWGGLYFGPEPGAPPPTLAELAAQPVTRLSGATVSGVEYLAGFGGVIPPHASVEVVNQRVLITNQTEISGGVNANGVMAVGTSAKVTVDGGSVVTGSEGVGVYATSGARLIVRGNSEVELNDGGGLYLTGYGTRADVDDQARIDVNLGVGLVAASQAHARVRADGTGGTPTSVSDNDGGLTALSGGSVDAGQCTPTAEGIRPNQIVDNHLGGLYDARAEGGSTVSARYAFWGTGRTTLVLVTDASSTTNVYPLAPTDTSPDPTCNPTESRVAAPSPTGTPEFASRGGAGAARDVSAEVVALATEARQAAWDGDPDAAFSLLGEAAGVAVTDDDREAVYEAIGALVAAGDSTLAVGSVVTALEATAGAPGANRLWARRALAVAYASTGRPLDADALADALTTEAVGTAHAVFGHAVRVRLAVEAGSAEESVSRLVAFAGVVVETDTFAVEAFGASLAFVAASFPDADLSVVTGGAREAAGVIAEAALLGSNGIVDGLSVYPNPAASRGTVRVSVSAAAERATATVYDALGRRVAVLHDGPLGVGAHDLALDVSWLAPGLYVVEVRVRPEVGAAWTEVRRVTVAR